MSGGVEQPLRPVRAHAIGPGRQAVADLVGQLRQELGERPATAVLYFASSHYDPAELAGPVARSFPDAAVVGCSTAGEFTDQVMGTGGISAVALPYGILTGAVAALSDLSTDPVEGTRTAVAALETSLAAPLRSLDPDHHLGFALIDGVNGAEETVNEVLGNAAPTLDVVGGSAADDLAYRRTWVAVGEYISDHGAALMICQAGVPFEVVKTCSFRPAGRRLRITGADLSTRTVHTIDGRPAADAYAAAVGVPADRLDSSVWMRHPLGQMIAGRPWIRSPQAVLTDGSMVFFARILPGIELELMQATDLVTDTRRAVDDARAALRGSASGAVLFNNVLRRLELDARGAGSEFLQAFAGLPTAGFHTYGETWLGHVNQTMTGVVFG